MLPEQDAARSLAKMRVQLSEVAWRRLRDELTGSGPFQCYGPTPARGGAPEPTRGLVDPVRSAESVDEERGRFVVRNDDHQPGEVVERRRETVVEVTQHARAVAAHGREHRPFLGIDPSAIDLTLVVQENRGLHGTLGRHHLVGIDRDNLVRRQVARVHTEPSGSFRKHEGDGVVQPHRASLAERPPTSALSQKMRGRSPGDLEQFYNCAGSADTLNCLE